MPDDFRGLEQYFAQSEELVLAIRRATEAIGSLSARTWNMGNALYIGTETAKEKNPCPMVP